MNLWVKIVVIVIAVIAALFLIGWIGLQVQPAPFKPFAQKSSAQMKYVPLPAGLPAPVERFYRKVYGDQIPVIDSVVITGVGSVRPFGPINFPARFRFTHIAGQGYRHYIEATFFGFPVFQVNERYVNGSSRFEIPVAGVVENDPKVNAGANLGMWSESLWFPAIFLTDTRVHWEAVDDQTAILVVPFENTPEHYVVRFDPQTSLVTLFEVMRYHGAESTAKTLWLNEAQQWRQENGKPAMQTGAAIWMDDGKPWAIFDAQEVIYNADVKEFIMAKGE